ncbi:PREDICTED: uncharacterized protein LOC103331128 [Prunus mume]|uniref:Uncharacterized protein LOC103331128 n=1 Tax=Prunus mume TaxID=102107 RepID=A0ABM0NZ08_PRUMU|nr:PREDICTED: uncharacterized protein LOC103331128 [Prunus mume]
MVVKMMRWPPWPPISTKKFEVVIVVGRLEGLDKTQFEGERRALVEVKWKGQKGKALGSLRRSVKRNFTKEGEIRDDGVVELQEEFRSLCSFSGYKEGMFYPWELSFTVYNAENKGLRNRVGVYGTASLNLAQYASVSAEKELGLNIPLNILVVASESKPSLSISLSILEMRATQEFSETVPGSILSDEAISTEKDELSPLKAGLRKVKILRDYVSFGKSKKACIEEDSSDSRSSARSEDAASNYPFDTDSLDDDGREESEWSKEDSSVRQSISYETLAYANFAGGLFYSNTNGNGQDDFWVHYSNRKLDIGGLHVDNSSAPVYRPNSWRSSKGRILQWNKRKLSFRSPKAKGESLLKKHYGEEGGDDIDFDRRQLSSSDESSFGSHHTESSISEFGDENFSVGIWEHKEVISRDGHMKLQTQVFFASIDQRSERAAGESACTALVAVITDWLKSNRNEMLIKCEFDSLIRDGSSEWRTLCDNEAYIERFPDKHFDLETILQAKIRPLSVVPEKSFIGFFHPEELENRNFDFLLGAMSFDSIWDEISRSASECACNSEPLVYIVSWNDHFFILKVEQDDFYIIDTLGERLYEGCNQAYILKFDKDTTIQRLPSAAKASDEKSGNQVRPNNCKETKAEGALVLSQKDLENSDVEEEVVCKGKEACKEYIKSFLAAIPIREMLADLKKGLMASTPLHHRLQIEFHCTKLLQSMDEYSVKETAATAPAMAVA